MIYSSTIIRTMNLLLQSLPWQGFGLPPLSPPLPLVLADASNEWLYNGSAVVSLELIQLKS